jgi:hypothetical protein
MVCQVDEKESLNGILHHLDRLLIKRTDSLVPLNNYPSAQLRRTQRRLTCHPFHSPLYFSQFIALRHA